jgi:hypothetical protein
MLKKIIFVMFFLPFYFFLPVLGNSNNCTNGDLGISLGLKRLNGEFVNIYLSLVSGNEKENFSVILTDGKKTVLSDKLKNIEILCGKEYNFKIRYQGRNLIGILQSNTRSIHRVIKTESEFEKDADNLFMFPYYTVSYLNNNFDLAFNNPDKLVEYVTKDYTEGYFYYSEDRQPNPYQLDRFIIGKDNPKNLYLLIRLDESKENSSLQCYLNNLKQLNFFGNKEFLVLKYKKDIAYSIQVDFVSQLKLGLNSINCFVFNPEFADTANNIYPIYPLYVWKNR